MHIPTWKTGIAGVALLLAGCSAPSGVTHLAMPFGAGATTAGAQVPASTPEQAVEAIIQKANQEQQQALTQNSPQLMADTSTTAYEQQMAQQNAQMLSSGVKSIQLVKLQWGPVTVTGNSAQATTQETWRTVYSDATVDQGTDQNVYTLISQNGAWKISSDSQPPAESATRTQANGQPPSTISTAPAISQDTSSNWSGYAASGSNFTSVTGTWTIPSSASGNGVDATWVGIGGVNSRDLIQAGTQEMTSGDSHVQYQAWVETLPQASQQVPLAVAPGDSIAVTITQQSAGQWLLSLKDNTSGQAYSTTRTYNSSLSSAEWIEEAPSGGRSLAPLDNFGHVTFSAGSAIEDGKTVTISQANAQPITMIDGARQPIATPGPLTGSSGSSFTVNRIAAPSTPAAVPGPGRGFGRQPSGVVPGFSLS